MMETRNKFEKVFRCDLQGISDMLNSCMEYVEQSSVPTNDLTEDLRSRFKWVVTEMLTNAIKHSGVPECAVLIRNDQEKLVLEKADTGLPLTIKLENGAGKVSWPLESIMPPVAFEIYQNGIESLQLTAPSTTRAVFSVKEMQHSDQPVISESTTEHFGLLILTKASDAFEYEYEAKTGTNTFRCIFNLKPNGQ
ncbi:anti-sigma regulatory factor [Dyadobacter crusticola]|uniref:anti-sigma regulatory factor n=1 Tax=Dyadobacter crusticola TaxID=292407 RepID=UPI0012F84A44|nr:anti-sigma regulatory factor [Dyadobacter crusticola]